MSFKEERVLPRSKGGLKASDLRDATGVGFLSRMPKSVFLVAALAAVLHMAPYWRAQLQVPHGWTFTWNINGSPDYMQYRVFSRRTQKTGLLVDNRFTTEPNKPHIPVAFYYAIGKIASRMGVTPEFVSAYSGGGFAFILTILLFATVRYFLRSPYQTWWVFLTILIGGGLGPHLKVLNRLDTVRNTFVLKRTIVDGLQNAIMFESYRNHYIFTTLFDSHFLVFCLVALISVLSLYFALQKFSFQSIVLTTLLFAFATLLHIYEGVTLIMITSGVTFLCWRKGVVVRRALITSIVCIVSVVTVVAWQASLYNLSGLPVPSWRGPTVLFSELLIAYPLAWLLIFWGIGDYWRNAGMKECYLLGWALGCTLLTLSGPFYPYPDRGTMTLQIPIYIVAGAIYFSHYPRVRWLPTLVAVLVLVGTPAFILTNAWSQSSFSTTRPYRFMNAEHREMIELLRQRASESDVLIVDKSDKPWRTDDLWLAPEYPGKLYCGHFFLTVDYKRKCAEVVQFFKNADPDRQADFLRRERVRFIFVGRKKIPSRFEHIPGLVLVKAASIGSLFEYVPPPHEAYPKSAGGRGASSDKSHLHFAR